MATPAHHTAAAAVGLAPLGGDERVDAHGEQRTNPAVMWVTGPARAMPASVRRDSGCGLVYEA